MAGHAGGLHGGVARWLAAPGHPHQRRFVEFRSIHVSEYPARFGPPGASSENIMGTASPARVRWSGAWARGAGHRYQAEVVVRYRPPLELVAWAVRLGNGHVRLRAAKNLEQHARRDEPGAPPAVAAQGSHRRTLQPNQSALFIQHAEDRFFADSLRS